MKKKYTVILYMLVISTIGAGCYVPQNTRPVYEPRPSSSRQNKEIESPMPPLSDKKARRIGELSSAKPISPLGNPAVDEIIRQTRSQMEKGSLTSAFATAERGLAIDSSDARIWNLMAEIQLKQNNPVQAEQLAKKSNLLAKGNKSLQEKNMRIIFEAARRMQGQ